MTNDSLKIQVFLQLLQQLRRNGHRTLVFSQSKLLLDIIQAVLAEAGIGTCRIDGSVTGKDRQSIIDEVNDENSRADVCLLTTKACGFGITLTGADRVIVFDPSWNPAEDRQAVDRAYRIGQKNNVIVYRLIMAGTVEEKMYEKQVFKDGLRVVSERGSSSRYFSDQETRELFTLGGEKECACLKRLTQSSSECAIDCCPGTIQPLKYVLGYSKHDVLYVQENELTKDDGIKPRQLQSDSNGDADNKLLISNKKVNIVGAAPHEVSENNVKSFQKPPPWPTKSSRKPCPVIDLSGGSPEEPSTIKSDIDRLVNQLQGIVIGE